MYKKILVPVDGSDTAELGFQEALALARCVGGSLVVLNVVDTYPLATGLDLVSADTWQQISDDLRARGQSVLDACQKQAREQGVAAETQLVDGGTGRVADVIVDTARDTDCQLIVMGTHGRRGWSHLALGSDAERVTRLSRVPLLLVRHADAARI